MLTLKHAMQNMLRTRAKLRTLLSLEAGEGLPAGAPELMSVDLLFGDLSGSEDFRLLKRIALDRCTMLELSEELGISVEACRRVGQRPHGGQYFRQHLHGGPQADDRLHL